jgi:peptide deformylase
MSANAYCAAVPRSRFLTLDHFDAEGEKQKQHARGWLARILQHEIDHLDGVLCLDRMIPRTLVTRVSYAAHWSRLPAGEVLQRFGASWEPPTEHQE